MNQLILLTITRLARLSDTSVQRIHRKIAAGLLMPVAFTHDGAPMFDGARIDEYRVALSKTDGRSA